jgi:hypothetical protein
MSENYGFATTIIKKAASDVLAAFLYLEYRLIIPAE